MEGGSWKKNGATDRGANEEEEIESGGVRSERKDPIMCMSGCIMASCHPAEANQHSRSLNSENVEQHHFLWRWLSFYVQSAADSCFVLSCVLTDWLALKKLSSVYLPSYRSAV